MEQMSKIDVELALQRLEGVTAMLSAFALEDGSHKHQSEAFFLMSEIAYECVGFLKEWVKSQKNNQ